MRNLLLLIIYFSAVVVFADSKNNSGELVNEAAANEATTNEALLDELGLPSQLSETQNGFELIIPKQLEISKRAVALLGWARFEKELYTQDAKTVCDRTAKLHESRKKLSADRLKRLNDIRIHPPIPMDQCIDEFPAINRKCLVMAREFYVNHAVTGSISEPAIQKAVTSMVFFCPSAKMLGFDANRFLESVK